MRNALAMRIFLHVTCFYTLALAANTLSDLDRICDDPEVSCRWRDVHRHAKGRTLQAPVILITTTTTTMEPNSVDNDANIQIDFYVDPHDPDSALARPIMLTYCMLDNISSAESQLRERVVSEFFRQLYIQRGEIRLEVNSELRSVIPMVMLVAMQDTIEDTMKMITYASRRLLVTCLWLGEFSSLDWNFMLADLADRERGIMLAPLTMDPALVTRSSNVFSLAPDMKYFLDTALNTMRRTGYIDTAAYVYMELADEQKKCSRIDELAETMQYTVVFRKGVATEHEFLNVALDLKKLAPDLLVLCFTDQPRLVNEFVKRLESERVEPKAFIIGDLILGRLGKWYGDIVDFMTGVDLWAKTLATTSDLIFTNMSNAELGMILDNINEIEETDLGSTRVSACETKYVLLWTCLELSLWAVESTQFSYDRIVLSGPLEVLNKLRLREINSFAGTIKFNEFGQRDYAEYMVLQWHPASNSSAQADLQVVAPTKYATRWLWFPKPTWTEMACFQSDLQAEYQSHGFSAVDAGGHFADCRRCDPGYGGVSRLAQVSQLEVYGQLAILVCEMCPVGKFARLIVFQDGVEDQKCIECPVGHFTNLEGSSTCTMCPAGRYEDRVGMSRCTKCIVGRHASSTGQTACTECEHPLVAAYVGSIRCAPCPDGADCPLTENGYSTYISKKGFYRIGPEEGMSDTLWRKNKNKYPLGMLYVCPHIDDVCLSNNTCSDPNAMHGPMCGTCRPGYEKGGPYQPCQECPSLAGSILYLIFDNALLIAMTLVIYFECVASKSHHDHQIMIVLKQLLSYIWLMKSFNPYLRFRFGGDQSDLNYQLSLWKYANFGQLAYQCLLHDSFPDEHVAYSMIVAAFLAIPFCLIQLLPTIILKYPIHRCLGILQKEPVLEALVACCIILVYMAHRNCTSAFLEVFRCLSYDEYRLLMQTTIKCQSDEHYTWQKIAIVGLAVISFGLPAIFVVVMRMHRQLWNDAGMKKYGFLHIGFKHEYWYWESVLMLRNVVLAGTGVLPILRPWGAEEASRYDASQVGLLTVSVAWYILHRIVQPWDDRSFMYLDRLETSMLQAFIVMFALQVAMQNLFIKPVSQQHFDLTTSFVTLTTCVFHIRFLYFVLRGLAGPLMKKKICACNRNGRFSKKNLVLWSTGIELRSSKAHHKRLVASLFVRVAKIHLQSGDIFDIKAFVDSMRKVFIMASYWRHMEQEVGRHAATVYEDHLRMLGEDTQTEATMSHPIEELGRAISKTLSAASKSMADFQMLAMAMEDIGSPTNSETLSTPDKDLEGPKELIHRAQTSAEDYHGDCLSISAVFRSYLRERRRIADQVKEIEHRNLQLIHIQAVERAEEIDLEKDEEQETAKLPDLVVEDTFMDLLADEKLGSKNKEENKDLTNSLPPYRMLLSHVRGLETELKLSLQENDKLKTALETCKVPHPLTLEEGPSLQETASAEEEPSGAGPMSRQESLEVLSPGSIRLPISTTAESATGSAMGRRQQSPLTVESADDSTTGRQQSKSPGMADDERRRPETFGGNDENGPGQEDAEFDEEEAEKSKREEQRLRDELAMLRSEIEREKKLVSERQEEANMLEKAKVENELQEDPLNRSRLAQAAAVTLAGQESTQSSITPQQRERVEPRGSEQTAVQESRRSSKSSITPQQHTRGERRGSEQATVQESRRSSKSASTPPQRQQLEPKVSERTAAKLVSVKDEVTELEGKKRMVEMQCEALTKQIDIMHELLMRHAKEQKEKKSNRLGEEKTALGVDDENADHPLVQEIRELQQKIAVLHEADEETWRASPYHAEEEKERRNQEERSAELTVRGPVAHERKPPFYV